MHTSLHAPFPPIVLKSRRVELTPLTPELYSFAFELAFSQAGTRPPAFQQFVAQTQGPVTQVVIRSTSSKAPIGLVSTNHVDLVSGTAEVGLSLVPSRLHSGLGIEAAALFLNYLFEHWNFRKVYALAPDFTYHQFSSGRGRFFVEEGCFKRHRYWRGQYWDVHVISVPRDKWEEHGTPILDHFQSKGIRPSPESSRP